VEGTTPKKIIEKHSDQIEVILTPYTAKSKHIQANLTAGQLRIKRGIFEDQAICEHVWKKRFF
jgi:hypothetical protein